MKDDDKLLENFKHESKEEKDEFDQFKDSTLFMIRYGLSEDQFIYWFYCAFTGSMCCIIDIESSMPKFNINFFVDMIDSTSRLVNSFKWVSFYLLKLSIIFLKIYLAIASNSSG